MLTSAFALSWPLNLAQAGSVGSVIGWCLVLVTLVFAGFFTLVRLRRWMKEDPAPLGIGFTLDDLRAMHKRGEMTDEQFEKARQKMVKATQAAAEKIKPPGPPGFPVGQVRDSVDEIRARAAARRAAEAAQVEAQSKAQSHKPPI
jgi:hypothetical protein